MGDEKIKILINTDSAALHSGLSETTRNIFIPLLQMYPDKYEIHQCGWFDFKRKEPVPWPIYPTKFIQHPNGQKELDQSDKYGQKTVHELIENIKPDIVFGYGDLWTFDHILLSPLRNTFRLCVYYTVDGQPYHGHINSDGSTQWGKMLNKADSIVSLSHFGRDTLYTCCPELSDKEIHVRYHPLEMARYENYTDEQIKEMRSKILPPEIMSRENLFIIGWVGRNQFRKQNYKLWELLHYMRYGDYIKCKDCGRVTVKEFNHSAGRSKNPKTGKITDQYIMYDQDYEYNNCWHCKSENIVEGEPDEDIFMWFQMSKTDPGYNSEMHERLWGVNDRTIFTNNTDGMIGISKKDVARLYSLFDVMYYPSGGEGFGNPAFECMAAGTPLVFSNYSSHAEFCKFGGLPVRGTFIPELNNAIQRIAVDNNHAVEQMLKIRKDKELRDKLGNDARQHAIKFDIGQVVPGWDRIFTSMMKKPLPINSNKIYATQI